MISETLKTLGGLMADQHKKRTRFLTIPSSYQYIPFSHKQYFGFVSREFNSSQFDFLFKDTSKLFTTKNLTIVRESRKVTTGVIKLRTSRGNLKLFIKRYNFFSILYRLKNFFRPSKTFKLYFYAFQLLEKGINTAYPIAACERRVCGFCIESYFITEGIPDSCDYTVFLRDREKDMDKSEFLKSLAILLGKLHKEGFSHGHLSDDNIQVSQKTNSNLILAIIDLDLMKSKTKLSKRYKTRDLASVGADVSNFYEKDDFLSSFEIYSQFNPEFLTNKKKSIQQIFKAIKKKENKRIRKYQKMK